MGDRDQKSLNALLSQQSPEQLQAIGQALAKAAAESHALLSEVMSSSTAGMDVSENADPFGVMDTYGRLGKSLATNPSALMTANLDLWMSWVNLWKDFTSGEIGQSGDKRFKDPEWSTNPAFEFMRRAYELNAEWMLSLLNAADDLSDADRRKARFHMRQTVDALSPTNFFATNPAALKAMLQTGGQSLVDGLRNARADMRKGRGKLSISQSDENSFEVGKNLATAPGKVVFRNRLIELLQFEPSTGKVHERPLLIFPPWINKYYILDLGEQNSMIRWLVSQGFTVFVVSWRSADKDTRELTWDDYVREGVMAALNEVTVQTGSKDINTVGYCIGGTLLTSALAYMAQSGDKRIASATFFASQSDFSDAGDLMVFADEASRDTVRHVIEANDGIMPGELMGETFNWLRPVDLVWRYVVDNYMLGKKPRPFDLLYWNADQTNIPGQTHRTYLDAFYGENQLSRSKFSVLGKTVSMEDINIPVTIQASREDHICPWHSIYRGARRYGGDVNFILAGSGHIAGVINHPDAEKYQHWMNDALPETPEAWLADAEEIKGSWWPSWMTWLKPKAGELVAARHVPDKGLGDAPGTYVKMRLKAIADGEKPTTDYSRPAKTAPNKTKKPTAAGKASSASGKKTRTAPASSAKNKTSSTGKTATSKKPASPAKKKPGVKKAQGKSGSNTSSPSA